MHGRRKNSIYVLFVGINEKGIFNTALASVYHEELQNTTLLQHHWAGKGTRGVAQFNGEIINEILRIKEFANKIDIQASQRFLTDLMNR